MGFDVSRRLARRCPIVSIALAFAVITSLHMTLGEQAPKMWALRAPRARRCARPGSCASSPSSSGPFIAALNGALERACCALAGVPAGEIHEPGHTAEEIRSILWLSARTGEITERELEITENVFRHDREGGAPHRGAARRRRLPLARARARREPAHPARERPQPLPALRVRARHDRRLRAREGRARHACCAARCSTCAALAREQLFVPDTMSLADFLRELQQKQQHYAVGGGRARHGDGPGLPRGRARGDRGSARRRVRREASASS